MGSAPQKLAGVIPRRTYKMFNYTSSGCMIMEADWGGNLKLNNTSSGCMVMEVDWGGNLKLNNTSSGCMLMEVDWGGNLKLKYTSCGCMLMGVDWGSKLIVNSMVEWGTHETHPTGHSISELDWGGNDFSSNHMNEFLPSEVDWRAHDSSFFLFW